MKFLGRQWFKLVLGGTATSERSVVVITGRCQRLNPGSSPGARILGQKATLRRDSTPTYFAFFCWCFFQNADFGIFRIPTHT